MQFGAKLRNINEIKNVFSIIFVKKNVHGQYPYAMDGG